MAGSATHYALQKLSTPAGFVLPGDALEGLNDDTLAQLVEDGLATTDEDAAQLAQTSYQGVPDFGTTTGGLEIIEQDISGLPLPALPDPPAPIIE